MLDTHPCAIATAGCREACPTSHLMCVLHWRMVPMSLQREVWSAYRRWRSAISRNGRRGCTEESFNSIRALHDVQKMAIQAVVEKLRTRDDDRQEGQSRIF